MKLIIQLWNETPRGEAIKDKEYLLFSDILVYKLKMNIFDFERIVPGVWSMTAAKAILKANEIVLYSQSELDELERINRRR